MAGKERPCCLGCPLRAKSLFAELGPAEEARLRAAKRSRSYRKGELIFAEGEPVTGIFCVAEGAVRISQTEEGAEEKPAKKGGKAGAKKTLLVRVAGPGDTVGHRSVFTRATFRGTAEALLPSSLCFVPKETLLELLGASPAFALRLLRRMARDLELSDANQGALRTGTIDERLVLLLRQLAEAHGEPAAKGRLRIGLPLSRADLGAMLGVAEETVIRGLGRLRSRGLIAEENSRILLLDGKDSARKN